MVVTRIEGIVDPFGVVVALHFELVLEAGTVGKRQRQPPEVVAVEGGETVGPGEAGDHRAEADGVGVSPKQEGRLTGLDDGERPARR